MIVALTGGTGGAKLIDGLASEIDPAELTIICNTGDDALFHGLHVSPDLDTILYTLAGLIDSQKGWGIGADSFFVLEQLRRLGCDAWFNLGDKDFATHVLRTQMLREGSRLSEVTERLRVALKVKASILPMCDERVETRLVTPSGELSFQEFFVKEGWRPAVLSVRFAGAESSRPAPGVIEAIQGAQAIIICPSNPITSIGPMLAVSGIRSALIESKVSTIAVSPIIGTTAISGPADKLLTASGFEASAFGVARYYAGFLDSLVIAVEDCGLIQAIEALPMRAMARDIRMPDLSARRRLARELLALVRK